MPAAHLHLAVRAPQCSACGLERAPNDLACACGASRPNGGWIRPGGSDEALRSPETWLLGTNLWILGVALNPHGPVLRYRATAPDEGGAREAAKEGVAMLVSEPNLYPIMEARTQALTALRHPAIRPLHDSGRFRNRPYRVDPSPPKVTATTTLRARGALPLEEALNIGIRIADALVELHAYGIVHGHLCPDTVQIVDEGGETVPVLVEIPAVDAGPWLPFVAPEVLHGGRPDPRSDLFGLGIVLICLLRGSPLPADAVVAPWPDHRPGPALPVPADRGLDEELRTLLLSLVDRDPTRRPRAAAAVHHQLRRALATAARASALASPAAAPPARPAAPPAPRPAWPVALAVIAVLGGFVWWSSPRRMPAPIPVVEALQLAPPAESLIAGDWQGEAGGQPLRLHLQPREDGHLEGIVTMTEGPTTAAYPVRGEHHADGAQQGSVSFIAEGAAPPAVFIGRYTPGGLRGELHLGGKSAGSWEVSP